MGVDYLGNYGVGVQLDTSEIDFDALDENSFEEIGYECQDSYAEFVLKDVEDSSYFTTGAGSYTGEKNDIFICMNKPFINGEFNKVGADKFINDLKSNNIKFIGELDVIGGLEVY